MEGGGIFCCFFVIEYFGEFFLTLCVISGGKMFCLEMANVALKSKFKLKPLVKKTSQSLT